VWLEAMVIPLLEQVLLLAILPVDAGSALRQPHCSGDSTISLEPYVRCDVHLVDLQVAELYGSLAGDVNHIG
jgi:hypothetical protein